MGEKMNVKQWIGFSVCIIGVVAVLYSVQLVRQISKMKSDLYALTHPLSDNVIGKKMGGEIAGALEEYDAEVMWLLSGGIVLTVIGGSMVFFFRKN